MIKDRIKKSLLYTNISPLSKESRQALNSLVFPNKIILLINISNNKNYDYIIGNLW